MILKMFTVYDSKTAAYLQPFYEQSIGSALRSFEDATKDPDHVFNKHSEDFTLFAIGEFDNSDCTFILHDTPTAIIKAIEILSQEPTLVQDQNS